MALAFRMLYLLVSEALMRTREAIRIHPPAYVPL